MTGLKPRLIEAVQQAVADGLSPREAAERIGVCRKTVDKYAAALKVGFAPSKVQGVIQPNARADEMARRYRRGETLEQIGQSFGITRERVRQLISKHHGLNAKHSGRVKIADRKKAECAARRDAKALAKWGCTWAQYKLLRAIGAQMRAGGCGYERTPLGAYSRQRANAGTRGIRWELNLWQWWTLWQDSGHWEQRGRGHGYGMARFGDTGPYAVGNVEIIPSALNTSLANKRSDLPVGVTMHRKDRGRYRAVRQEGGKLVRLGTFTTPEAAHAAYLAAGGL